jgi:hypothetical protein
VPVRYHDRNRVVVVVVAVVDVVDVVDDVPPP